MVYMMVKPRDNSLYSYLIKSFGIVTIYTELKYSINSTHSIVFDDDE